MQMKPTKILFSGFLKHVVYRFGIFYNQGKITTQNLPTDLTRGVPLPVEQGTCIVAFYIIEKKKPRTLKFPNDLSYLSPALIEPLL